VAPLNVYGWTKAEAEQEVGRLMPQALIVRTSAFFGPWDIYNFATVALRELRAGRPFAAARDQVVSPTYVPHLTDATLDLLIDGESGIWHLASEGALSWYEFAARVAALAGVDTRTLIAIEAPERRAAMPRYSVLGSERGKLMPPLEHAFAAFVDAVTAASAGDDQPPRT
jgi:dTDP-4-dehydrorhamnose reductase